jgi:hypothetical protein
MCQDIVCPKEKHFLSRVHSKIHLERLEEGEGHAKSDGQHLQSILKNIGQTEKKLLEKLCNKHVFAYVFAANLYEPPYETIDPYPQGHQLIVTKGQTHYRQSVQFALRPEAANKKSNHFNQYPWFTKIIN